MGDIRGVDTTYKCAVTAIDVVFGSSEYKEKNPNFCQLVSKECDLALHR
jgi:hypothetical protein